MIAVLCDHEHERDAVSFVSMEGALLNHVGEERFGLCSLDLFDCAPQGDLVQLDRVSDHPTRKMISCESLMGHTWRQHLRRGIWNNKLGRMKTTIRKQPPLLFKQYCGDACVIRHVLVGACSCVG